MQESSAQPDTGQPHAVQRAHLPSPDHEVAAPTSAPARDSAAATAPGAQQAPPAASQTSHDLAGAATASTAAAVAENGGAKSPSAQQPRAPAAAPKQASQAGHRTGVKAEDHYPSPPHAPLTPAATSSSPGSFTIPLPSFVHDDPLSSDPDSSSDEDSFGETKPPRPARHSKSTGLPRPVPSYYYDAEYDPGTAGNKKRGRRGGYKGVPVFEPTMEDFAKNGGFYGYVKRIEKYGLRSGIVKVIPPKEWSDSLPSVAAPLRKIRLKDAIEQHMVGSQGLYRVMNEAKARTYSPIQWKDLSRRDKWEGPDLVAEAKKGDRSERAAVSEKVLQRRRESAAGRASRSKGKGRAKDDEADEADEEDGSSDGEGASKGRRAAPARKAKTDGAAKLAAKGSASNSPAPSPAAGSSSSAAARPKVPHTRTEPTNAEWKAFADKLYELPHDMKKEDYTVERMRDFERRYWRTLTFGEPPMYGADMAGSLFDDSTQAWNVASLGDLLPKLAPKGCEIPGVVTPYLYFGMWRATFAWHVEDADLYSINYIHFGAPKFWYSVPQEQSERFERVMEGLFPTDRSKCSQFLRHKAFLASPKILSNHGITLNRCAQLPGEFILTYPKGYHSGFNLGFNCAESINFATERWLPLGKVAKHCHCIDDSVNIDVNIWLRQAAKDEALERGEDWPYDELEEQALQAAIEAEEREAAEKAAAAAAAATLAAKRRASAAGDEAKPRKKLKPAAAPYQIPMVLVPVVPGHAVPGAMQYTLSVYQALQSPDVLQQIKQQLVQLLQHPSGQWRYETPIIFQAIPHPNPPPPPPPQPRTVPQANPYAKSAFQYQPQVIQSKPAAANGSSSASHRSTPAPAKPAPPPPPPPKEEFACALCPDRSKEGLVRVGEPGVKSAKKRVDAHRVCVMFTPATWIEIDPVTNEEIVRGFANIEKARWKLKCQLCTESHGTKVQCTKGKCIKAFHVTCALREESGVHMDATIPDEDGAGSISLLEQTRASTPVAEAAAADASAAPAPAPPASPSKPALDNDQIRLSVLCRTHNPEWQRLETERKAAELRAKVAALERGARLRVRTPGGIYDVTYESAKEETEDLFFAFEDGKRSSVKWKNVIWPDSPEVQRKKEEAARRAEREKMAILDRPAYKAPTKRSGSSSGVSSPAPAAAVPPSHQQVPQAQPRQAYYGVPHHQPQQTPYGYAAPQQQSPYQASYGGAYPQQGHPAASYGYSQQAQPQQPQHPYAGAYAYQQHSGQQPGAPSSSAYPSHPQQQQQHHVAYAAASVPPPLTAAPAAGPPLSSAAPPPHVYSAPGGARPPVAAMPAAQTAPMQVDVPAAHA
ncbi:hypothetical protein Rhopal_007809-T1 [Rhodotorula paludigena]|uniref:[histone H3]-trimethyl-L-lysine(9) demethylase n=1 Tax=Rhodotorula paludigena TaxID=86838 RepID=A0AAV5H1X4_9BASI|nr:hypothetical protein Rhopal_007809-T1 [Rhodotorula paludigena]